MVLRRQVDGAGLGYAPAESIKSETLCRDFNKHHGSHFTISLRRSRLPANLSCFETRVLYGRLGEIKFWYAIPKRIGTAKRPRDFVEDQLHDSRKALKMQGGELAETSQRVTRRA